MKFVAKDSENLEHVIGLGESKEEALVEPLDNGYKREEIVLESVSEERYKKYLDLYT